jgi:hypothetical protein
MGIDKPPTPDSLRRLGTVLLNVLGDKKNFYALQEDIKRLTRVSIDRRALQDIVEGNDRRFSFEQLEALDRYIGSRQRFRLADVFESTAVMRALVAQNHVRVLIGSQPRSDVKRTDLSRWDALAMHDLFRHINRVSGKVLVDFEDVMFLGPENATKAEAWRRTIEQTDWYRSLAEDGPSVVSLGSQRACLASEVALSKMFGVVPFAKSHSVAQKLPFCFIWPSDQQNRLPSAFSRGPESLGKSTVAKLVRENKAWAFQVHNDVYRSNRFVEQSKTYGILAAQRRRGGSIWLVVAGLNGPGTYAASTHLNSPGFSLPLGDHGKDSPVVWIAVEADVELRQRAGDDREVVGSRVIAGPEQWNPIP